MLLLTCQSVLGEFRIVLKSQMRWSGERQDEASGHAENRKAGNSYRQGKAGSGRSSANSKGRTATNPVPGQQCPARQTVGYGITCGSNGRKSSRRVQYEPDSRGCA